jgi:antitoxin component YwqK of YwqJK toxin-antitoxin module
VIYLFKKLEKLKAKKLILTFVLISHISYFIAQTTNPNGYNTFYYENGAKSSEGTMRDGKADGYWKNYYKNGKLKIEGNRRDFQLDSIWKFYSEKGKITKAVNYLEGKKNGYTLNYDTNQRVSSKEAFINDIKQGNSFTYYPSGKTKLVTPYVKGKPDGIAYEYSEDSVIISIIKYQGGILASIERMNRKDENGKKQGLWKDFFEDGKLKEEKKYKDDLIDGYVKTYDKKGNLENTQKFNNGKQIKNAPELAKLDVYKEFYEDGTMKYEGGYINGMPVGTHYHYKQKFMCDSLPVARDDTSDVMIKVQICRNRAVPDSAIVYNEGIKTDYGAVDSLRNRVGIWTEYHNTGEFRGKGLYLNDKRIGEWVFYYPNGQIEQKGKYDKKGRAQAEWKWFYENGSLMRQEIYLDNLRNGEMIEYTEDGKIITKGEYIDDLQEGLWFFETPEYKEIGKYVNDKPDSLWKSYYMPKEKLRFEGKFLNGDEDGQHTWYYSNGKKMVQGSYTGGMKQGDWKFYDEAGYNYLTIFYDNDIEIKFQGVKVVPTYEESLRDYSSIYNKKPDKTINLDKEKKKTNEESDN